VSGARTIGPYTLLESVGRGAQGEVFRARAPGGGEVALKVLLVDDERMRERLLAEARLLARLRHPHVVPLLDASQDGGRVYLALEWVPGGTLEERLLNGPLQAREAARHLRNLADAIQHAHEQKVLHRDLKPANVLLDVRGSALLTDFGVARGLDDERRLTTTGALLGSPGYWAPEQATGETSRIGPATDVFGLGAVLYATLTGQPPFRGGSFMEEVTLAATCEPAPPHSLKPDVDRRLEAICLRCLAAEPSARYPSAAALGWDLEAYLSSATPPPPRSRWKAVAAAGAAVVLAVAVGVGLADQAPATGTEPQPVPPRGPDPDVVAPAEPADVGAALAHARLLVGERRWEEALTALEEVRGAAAEDPEWWFARAWARFHRTAYTGHRQEWVPRILDDLDRVQALAPADPRVPALRSLILKSDVEASRALELGRETSGLAWIAELSRRDRNPGERELRYRAIREAGAQAVRLEPGSSWIATYRVRVLYKAPRDQVPWEEAEAAFDEAARRFPAEPGLLLARGWALKERGSLEQRRDLIVEAVRIYDQVLEFEPRYATALLERGWARNMLGDISGAQADLSAAAALDHTNFHTHHLLGLLNYQEGDYAAANAAWSRAIFAGPEQWHLHRYRALSRSKSGDLAGTIRDLERALELAPPEQHDTLRQSLEDLRAR
jgi:tetratricopeptide (TPR) repeat protein